MLNKLILSVALFLMPGFAIAADLTADQVSDEGVELTKQQKFDDALVSFSKTIQLNPQFEKAYYFRAVTYYT